MDLFHSECFQIFGSNIFETFRFASITLMLMRKKNQRLSVFLYQLVNLVLETCFIFSKWCLKVDKTKNVYCFGGNEVPV